LIHKDNRKSRNQKARIELFQEERNELRQKAKEAIAEIQQENRKYYNRKRRVPSKYKVDDLVVITRTQGEGELKLAEKYLSP